MHHTPPPAALEAWSEPGGDSATRCGLDLATGLLVRPLSAAVDVSCRGYPLEPLYEIPTRGGLAMGWARAG